MKYPIFHKKIWRYQIRDALIYWAYIPAAVVSFGKIMDSFFSFPSLPAHKAITWLAALLLVAGIIIIWKSMEDLSRFGQGTANPLRPPKELVNKGSYGICRHPMFLGYNLAALGVIIFFRSAGMLIISYPILIAFETWFLKKEEIVLAKRFHSKFYDYRRDVRFMIPYPKTRRERQ